MTDRSFYPKAEEINFTFEPKQLSASAYHDVRKYMIQYFSQSEDVVSLYEFGTVKAPSISDIDLLLVLKNNPSKKIHELINRNSINSLAQYLMMDNTLMIVDEGGFKNIPTLDEMNFRILYGKGIKQRVIGDEERLYIEIARVMDWLPERTMRMVELVSRKEIPVRATLCLINSFIYVLERLRDTFDIRFNGADDYINNFFNLRKTWFTIEKRNEVLYDYLKHAIEMGFQAIKDFDDYLLIEGFYDPTRCPATASFRLNPKITSWTKKKMYYNFTNNHDEISAKESLARSSDGDNIIVIPNTYYQHLLTYGLTKKTISTGIKNSLKPYGKESMSEGVHVGLKQTLDNRMLVIDNMGSFLRENSINRGLLKFGWFL